MLFKSNSILVGIAQDETESEAVGFIDGVPDRAHAKFEHYGVRLRDGHSLQSPEMRRHLRTREKDGIEVHELKVHLSPGFRLYVIPHEGFWLATHGRKKPKDKQVNAEIDHAFKVFDGWRKMGDRGQS